MYIGDENGGIGVCMRHFFEKAPSAINVTGLSTDEATVTAWIHPDDVLPLDMRHYDTIAHDQTFYEGYPWIGSDPYGIAATNELSVFIYDEPTRSSKLWKDATEGSNPAVLICEPDYYRQTRVLGEFSLPDRSTPLKAWLEDELDKAVGFYMREVEQRHWYGLFNYGDVMHTYDRIRHSWRYDMGGYAWQNTELVPTLWLWYAFLRSGRGDIFNMAEAMSRHAADVDVYHFGDKKGLGSRHNVIHWGDSCKEPRVAMAGHHRALYYLMGGDFRIGDVFDDVLDADFATIANDPLGAFYDKSEMKLPTHARSGPDWSTYCSNWYTEWERHKNTKYRDKIQTGIDDLKKAPLKMISGSNFEYDPETGHLGYIGESAAGGAHLMICMGGPETWTELAAILHDEEFRRMLIGYGEFYYLTPEEKRLFARGLIDGEGYPYPYMAASMVAYAARETKNKELAYKVWQVLIHSLAGEYKDEGFDSEIIENYYNNKQLEEMFWITTNF
ncbi:MAG: LAGLIDADG family homing endonuclease, partial [Eggerthellaceae bacterium]|nr:LAGLIDADG family homing endonuclease [Eggerthellaceae bacterium]